MGKIKWTANGMPKTEDKYLPLMSKEGTEKALAFHKNFPQYSETPLAGSNHMATYLRLSDSFVKDESYRFGLNTSKVLGGSSAMVNYVAGKLKKDVSELIYDELTSDQLRSAFGQATFFTATDGNRGRGVTRATNKLGQKSVALMSKGSTQTRKESIEKEGATVTIEEVNYDKCVQMTDKMAEETKNSVMVQGIAQGRYKEVPTWIMQGYGTMALEASQQLRKFDSERPSHAFVQAGVDGLTGAMIGYSVNAFLGNLPVMVVVEVQAADCLYQSAIRKDGEIHFVDGDLQTIVADLACGEPNTVSFDILKNHTSLFVSAPDWVPKKGTCMLGAPLKGNPQVVSGGSGIVAMGLVATVMRGPNYQELREALQLDETSNVLMFSTEGDTNPDSYKKVLWK